MNKKQIGGIGIAVLLIAVYFGVKVHASNKAEERVKEVIAEARGVADIEYKKVGVGLPEMEVTISDILVSPVNSTQKIKIGEIIIHEIDYTEKGAPAFLSMKFNKIELNVKDLGNSAGKFMELGYDDKLLVDLNIDYNYDREKKELDIKNLSIGIKDAGEIGLSFRIGNIDLQPEAIVGLMFTYPQCVFNEAKITYEDASLFNRFMKSAAEEKGVDVSEYRKSIILEVEKAIENEKDEFTRKALGEIKKFYEDPRKLTISASPSEPLPIGRLMQINQPDDFIKALGIKIKS